jgi:hypothetical protein
MRRSARGAGGHGSRAPIAIAVLVTVSLLVVAASPVLAARDGEASAGRPARRESPDRDRASCGGAGEANDGVAVAAGLPAIVDALRHPASIEDLETRYELDVELRFHPARLRVHERIALCNRSDRLVPSVHLSVLARAFDEMRIREVRVGGRSVAASFPDPADMLVPLDAGLDPGEGAVIEVEFTLEPTRALRSSLHESLSLRGGLLRVSDWFPLVSDGHGLRMPGDSQVSAAADRITVDMRLDRRLDVAAPGTVLRREPRRQTYAIRHARDFAFAVAPRLTTLATRTHDGVRVEVMTAHAKQAGAALKSARQALEAYDDLFGPYAWRRLVVAPTTSLLGGDEYPGIAFIGRAWLDGPESWELQALRRGRPDRWFGLRYVVSHEVAHQWFYALVGSDQLREPWLDEALAEFASHHVFRPNLLTSCAERPVSSTVTDFKDRRSARGCLGYTETVYRGGAVMVDDVRRLLGDDAFAVAMRRYVRATRFGIATADDLIGAWREQAWSPLLLDALLARRLGAD